MRGALSLAVFLSVMILAVAIWTVFSEQIRKFVGRNLVSYDHGLNKLFIHSYTSSQILIGVILLALIVGMISWSFTDSIIFSVLMSLAVFLLPKFVFLTMWEKRIEQLEEMLPETLDQMASSAKAGLSLAEIINNVSQRLRPPVSQEFGLIYQEFRLGSDIQTAINSARSRLSSKMFDLLATAIIVNREKGGNLPETLNTMAGSFKEIFRLEQKLLTASAEGRKGVRIISIMPVFIFLFVSFVQPELIDKLTSQFIGWVMITVAVILYVVALFWIRKIMNVEI